MGIEFCESHAVKISIFHTAAGAKKGVVDVTNIIGLLGSRLALGIGSVPLNTPL